MSPYETTVIESSDRISDVVDDWLALLEAEPAGANWRNDPARVAAVLTAKPALKAQIVLVREGRQLRCVAPFYLAREHFAITVRGRTVFSRPIRRLFLFGDDFPRAPQGDVQGWLDAVFSELRQRRRSFDAISLQSIDPQGELGRFCAKRLAGHGFRLVQASPLERVHRLVLPATYQGYLATLSARTRQNLRRTTRRLFEDGHAQVVRVQAIDQVPTFLAHLDAVALRTWQARSLGLPRRNTPSEQHVFEQLAAQGWLRAYVLLYDDVPIAYELGVQYRDTFYGHECGYDERWADRGPGSVLMHLVIEDLFRERRPAILHFGFGDAAYKRSLRSNEGNEARHLSVVWQYRWLLGMRLQRALERFGTAVSRRWISRVSRNRVPGSTEA